MSGKSGSNNGAKGNNGTSSIPSGARKMVQSLKEIVNNCTEQEIYAMLKDCNMDPNETVNRLLAQDPFHEVKSKRDKKKENKDTTESRPRGSNISSSRGGKGGDRYGSRGGSSQYGSSNESGGFQGRPAHKKENGTHAYAGSSTSASAGPGYNATRRPSSYGDTAPVESKPWTTSGGENISSSPQPSSGFQSSWVGVPGQVSMADIVKMGRPQTRVSSAPSPPLHSANHQHVSGHQNFNSSQDYGFKDSEFQNDRGVVLNENFGSNDDWPEIEQPQVSLSSIMEAPANPPELYADPSQQVEEDEEEDEDVADETPNHNLGHASVSGRHMPEVDSGGEPVFDDNLYKDMSYQPHGHHYEHKAEDNTSSVAANLQQLSLQKDDRGAEPEEDVPAVIIPDHLQLHTPDCLHLSFGSFGAGPNVGRSTKSNLEETSTAVDVSAIGQPDTRNSEFYGDEHLRSTSDGSLMHRTTGSSDEYDTPSVSQEETLKQESAEADHENQYAFPSSAPGFTYETTPQLNAAYNHHQQAGSQMQNLTPFSNVMHQAYTNSLPSNLLASTVQGARDDLPYSPFPVAQSMPPKYSNAASSISAPSMSMPEALRAASISTAQPTQQQALPGGNVLPQHLPVHPYSQHTLPFANMIGYPFLPPQSYTYMPSAFQQAFAGNSTYPQSLAAVLPQYKNSVSVSSLPQSGAVASGYGFGSSTSLPGANFPGNPPAAPTGTTIGYDDVLSSQQYKDAAHLMSLQQSENSGMWVHGPGSRAMSGVPGSTYYGFQGQTQQHSGFRQAQQQQPPPSQQQQQQQQQFSQQLGYQNFYHSQSLDHHQQQQSARDAPSQPQQPSKQSQQLWQNTY